MNKALAVFAVLLAIVTGCNNTRPEKTGNFSAFFPTITTTSTASTTTTTAPTTSTTTTIPIPEESVVAQVSFDPPDNMGGNQQHVLLSGQKVAACNPHFYVAENAVISRFGVKVVSETGEDPPGEFSLRSSGEEIAHQISAAGGMVIFDNFEVAVLAHRTVYAEIFYTPPSEYFGGPKSFKLFFDSADGQSLEGWTVTDGKFLTCHTDQPATKPISNELVLVGAQVVIAAQQVPSEQWLPRAKATDFQASNSSQIGQDVTLNWLDLETWLTWTGSGVFWVVDAGTAEVIYRQNVEWTEGKNIFRLLFFDKNNISANCMRRFVVFLDTVGATSGDVIASKISGWAWTDELGEHELSDTPQMSTTVFLR